MSKEKSAKSYKGEFGKITASENAESEFKVGLFYTDEQGSLTISRPEGSEEHILSIGEEIWNAYLPYRYAFEDRQGAAPHKILLADGAFRSSHHQEQKKESRTRSFFIIGTDSSRGLEAHPYDLEIRVEDRDGKRIMMLKKGNGANPEKPVIRRHELKLVGNIREKPETMLRELPDHYKKQMGFEFGKHSRLYMPMQSESERMKTKVRLLADTIIGPLHFVLEPAFDAGSGGLLVTGRGMSADIPALLLNRWPIREFEDEVKGVYRPGSNIDIKADPCVEGMSDDQMTELCASILQPEREDYMEFAQLYLLEKAREDAERYGDIEVAGIYDSKSKPGRRLLKAWLEKSDQSLADAMSSPKPTKNHADKRQPELIPGLAA